MTDPETNKLYVHITGAIGMLGLDSSHSHFQLTEVSWNHIRKTMKHRNYEDEIVGWFHSHPGFGPFLSATDLATQEAFFAMPWGVAIVYDPIHEGMATFIGPEGKSCKLFPYGELPI